jgi:hypothetical protein
MRMPSNPLSFLRNDSHLLWTWFGVSLLALTAGNTLRVCLTLSDPPVRALMAVGTLLPALVVTLVVLVTTRMYHRVYNHHPAGTDVVFFSPIVLTLGLLLILGAVGFGHALLLTGVAPMAAVFGSAAALFSLLGAITALVIAARPPRVVDAVTAEEAVTEYGAGPGVEFLDTELIAER